MELTKEQEMQIKKNIPYELKKLKNKRKIEVLISYSCVSCPYVAIVEPKSVKVNSDMFVTDTKPIYICCFDFPRKLGSERNIPDWCPSNDDITMEVKLIKPQI